MKIRNGFVSNSSSSSFIIAIAEITDLPTFLESMKDVKFDYHYNYGTFEELLEKGMGVNGEENELCVESFTSATTTMVMEPGKKYFVVDYAGNEGDESFMDSDDDIDYDIDSSFFDGNKTLKRILQVLFEPKKHGLGKTGYEYGAGSNG